MKYNKHKLISRLYFDGSQCIESAEVLYKDKNKDIKSIVPYGVLLIHGIELLLKAYLVIKNDSLSDDAEELEEYLKSKGHNYFNIFLECKKYGKELIFPITFDSSISPLEVHLDSLKNTYYKNSIDVRYINETKPTLIDPEIFQVLALHLNRPIFRLMQHRTIFPGIVKFDK